MRRAMAGPKPNREQMRAKVRERFDANHDGKITGPERQALEQARQQFRQQQGVKKAMKASQKGLKRRPGGKGPLQSARRGKFGLKRP